MSAAAQHGSSREVAGENSEANEIIDSLEADIERIRNMDAGLLASLVGRLDELRKIVNG